MMTAKSNGDVFGRVVKSVVTLVMALGFAVSGPTHLSAQEDFVRPHYASPGTGPDANLEYWTEYLVPQDQVIAIRAGRLFEANAGTMLNDQVILIEGERIAQIGPDVDIPSNAQVIDLSNATVLPGMIDTHTHVTPRGNDQTTANDRAYQAVANAHKNLMAGFTTIFNVDSRGGYGTVVLRDAINSGILLGPRMQVTGQSINQRASGPYTAELPGLQQDRTEYKDINSPWLARAAVREAKLHGVDGVKIYTTQDFVGQTDHWTADGEMLYTPSLTYEEVEAIVDEAHRMGLKVVCHTYGGEGLHSCLRAGVDFPTHAEDLDDEAFRLFLDTGLPLVPTIDDLVYLEPSDLEASGGRNSRLRLQEQVIRRLHAEGVEFPFGSGAVGSRIPHGRQAGQFRYLVDWGLTEAEALQTAMTVAAKHLNHNWGEVIGALDPGKFADIIAVSGNPLSDITEMEQVRFVMKGGMVVRDDLTPQRANYDQD